MSTAGVGQPRSGDQVTSSNPRIGALLWVPGAIAFCLLCTMNSAGYRFGASDQALYLPAVLRHLDPALFPRDAPLIDTQARLMLNDEIIALAARATGLSLPILFLALYALTLIVLLAATARLGVHFYRSRITGVALAAAVTLRHAIAKTGTNTLEGYFHPRQLAFALGLLAVAMFVERRHYRTLALMLVVAAMHTTTALWFGVWLTVAAWLGRPRWRPALAGSLIIAVLAASWLLWRTPFGDRLHRMDSDWLRVIGDKDYLFPLAWPLTAWASNLAPLPVIIFAWRARRRTGLAFADETAVVVGALALGCVFFISLPFSAAHVALAVQLQVGRVFWILDLLATIYIVWALAEGTAAQVRLLRRASVVAAAIIVLSMIRGTYTCFIEFPNRRIVAVDLDHQDWRSAMAWARSTPASTGWLADPVHAALYGSSVRAAGQRDVLIDGMKDSALAIYDRGIAMRVAERRRALEENAWYTADGARALARRYGLDYLVTSEVVDLPVAYRAGALTIYRLR
jgi:hypothetical protein